MLDLTHHIAGPYCTKLLADFGAEVVKIERPGGDPARWTPPFFRDQPGADRGLTFAYLNTNKQSVTLDLKSPRGRDILLALVEDSDIVVENFSPRVMPSLGMDFETLRAKNPALVMVSISNFGQTGPYRDYKAADIVAYALGGLMYIFGAYDREPLKHAYNQAQFKAGTDAASAALIALYRQRLTGGGQHVDVSIQEAVATGLRDVVNNFTYTGAVRRRQPNHSGDLNRLRATADGHMLPSPGLTVGFNWQTVVDFLGIPELDDERFATPSARLANAEELGRILDGYFIEQNKYEMFYASHQHRFIFGVVQSPEEALSDPQFEHRGFFVEADHPAIGPLRFPGAPFNMGATPWRLTGPAPGLGQHTGGVLERRLGYSGPQLDRLQREGVI